jgi:hypothetical protein
MLRMKKANGILVIHWVKKLLGQYHVELDWVLVGLVEGPFAGLDLKPKGKRNKAVLMGHAVSDLDLDPVSVHDSGPSSKPGPDSVSKPISVPSSKDDPRVGILALESSMANGSVQVSFVESFGSTLSSSMSISWPDSFVPENFVVYSSRAVALGERFCSLLGMLENGTPLFRSVYKQGIEILLNS